MAMSKRTCSIDGCGRIREARGWCSMHYQRWRTHGDPTVSKTDHYRDPEESFAARTAWRGDCLVWTGYTDWAGYGLLSVHGERVFAHRYAWERVRGPIPKGMFIDHTCHTKPCVNVEHLRVATRAENARNRVGANRGNSTSGVRNVEPNGSGWMVRIRKGRRRHYFGTYASIEEAALVAEQKRKELFGEFAGKG